MASILPHPNKKERTSWRVSYKFFDRGRRVRKSKYSKERHTAEFLCTKAGALELHSRSGYGSKEEIEEWIELGLLSEQEAICAFPRYADVFRQRDGSELNPTDFGRLLEAYKEYSLRNSRRGADSGTHKSNMTRARRVVKWLEQECRDLSELSVDMVREYLHGLEAQYAQATVYQVHTILNLVLDQAVELQMISGNPARAVPVKAPKKTKIRRILNLEEINRLLEVSLNHRDVIFGGLPTVVRLGVYAGLRTEELCWLKWSSIDWEHRVINVEESVCTVNGKKWIPKDGEARRIGVKEECISYLEAEKQRQETYHILSDFILSTGKSHIDKPLAPNTLSTAFARMIKREGMDKEITAYCMRHSFATWALRKGVDIRTVQHNMGHSDIKTTMGYLHFVNPEDHPMDMLPY